MEADALTDFAVGTCVHIRYTEFQEGACGLQEYLEFRAAVHRFRVSSQPERIVLVRLRKAGVIQSAVDSPIYYMGTPDAEIHRSHNFRDSWHLRQ